MPRRKAQKKCPTVTLRAPVEPPTPPVTGTASEVADALGITLPTLRDWVTRGLPQHGTRARPAYVWSEVLPWDLCYKAIISRDGRCPRLSMDRARRWWLGRQRADDPQGWISVPMAWDHPERARLLELAAAGTGAEPDRLDGRGP